MKKRAFTLVELLTVIAIIALLSAIIFPVFARVKLNAYKSGDMAAMNSIRTSLQQYHDDQGGYPPALLGYITPYQYQNGVTVVPANVYRGDLYPKRVTSIDTLKGGLNRSAYNLMVPGAWPQADVRGAGTPILDLNADGVINAADDLPLARQANSSDYASSTARYFLNDPGAGGIGASTSTTDTTVGRFYAVSGYDVSPTKYPNGSTVYEMHYTLFWSGYGIGPGNILDDPRQLGYSDPPDTTVVTWDTYFRDYNNSMLTNGGSKDIVLFLGGSARPVDSKLMSERSWRLMP